MKLTKIGNTLAYLANHRSILTVGGA